MEAKLVVVGGKAQAGEFNLKLPAIVGRSRSADLPLNHPLVSRQHCEIFEADGHLMVRDLGSLNGTFVGDSRVTADALLTPGGHLTVGSVTFEAVYEAEPGTGDAPDFSMADENGDLDRTVEESRVHRAGAGAEADLAPAEESSGGIDMSWLTEAPEEEAGSAAAEEVAESPPNAADSAGCRRRARTGGPAERCASRQSREDSERSKTPSRQAQARGSCRRRAAPRGRAH